MLINQTYCICVDEAKGLWCAVLGNHYPNLPAPDVPTAIRVNNGKPTGSEEGVFYTQRLCDHNNVQYRHVVLMKPTCPDCLRIKQLMVEFARPEEKKECRPNSKK